jgi:hypothetical protein
LDGARGGRFRETACAIRLAKNGTIAYTRATLLGPEGVLDMRLWIAMTLAAVGVAAGAWWLTRSSTPLSASKSSAPEVCDVHPTAPGWPPEPLPTAVRPRNFGASATDSEPIAVVPETEIASEPVPTPALPTNLVRETSERLVPRPEAGIEPVPFMPYAEEDAELARLRRESQERLARQTAEPPLIRQIRELQETAEPPLEVPEPSWRPRGKLPCSVK